MKRWISCLCALILLGTLCAGSLSAAQPAPSLGDVNGDGAVDSSDARWLLQSVVGFQTLDGRQQFLGDVNTDGEINSSDARLLLQVSVEAAELSPYEVATEEAPRSRTFSLAVSSQPTFPQIFRTREELLAFGESHLSDTEQEALAQTFDAAYFEEHAAVLAADCAGEQAGTVWYTDGTLLLTVTLESDPNPSGVIHAGVVGVPKALLEGRELYVYTAST